MGRAPSADWPRKVPTRHKAEESESEGEKVKFRFSDGCPGEFEFSAASDRTRGERARTSGARRPVDL